MSDVSVCLWFNADGEEAARFYTSLLPDSQITEVVRAPGDYPMGQVGDALVVHFTLGGRPFMILNGHMDVPFTQAVSMVVDCEDQAEVDRYWAALTAGGGQEVQCGWCKDRWGLSWQVVPRAMTRLLADPDRAKAGRAFAAMQQMIKLDVAALERAAVG